MEVTAGGTADPPVAVPPSAFADTVLPRPMKVFGTAADAVRTAAMRAYTKDLAPFLGLTSPDRRAPARTVLAGARADEAGCTAVALRCRLLPKREYHYFAVGRLCRHVSISPPVSCPWRGTTSAPPRGGTPSTRSPPPWPGRVADPVLRAETGEWIGDDDLRVVRTALLHQLTLKAGSDTDRLFGYCLRQSGHPEFFVRKATGRRLRQYAWTGPDAAQSVAQERDCLSPLPVPETPRNIGP